MTEPRPLPKSETWYQQTLKPNLQNQRRKRRTKRPGNFRQSSSELHWIMEALPSMTKNDPCMISCLSPE